MSIGQFASQENSKRLVPAERAEQLNPYASPLIVAERDKPPLAEDQWHLLRIHVVDVQKQAMRRRIFLDGDVEAEICYDGWVPSELIIVNETRRYRGYSFCLSVVTPKIEFEVETRDHRVPAIMEAKAAFSLSTVFRLTEFRIIIGGQLIYSDDG